MELHWCDSGYSQTYKIENNKLYMDELFIQYSNDKDIEFFGKSRKLDGYSHAYVYSDINKFFEYTGRILAGGYYEFNGYAIRGIYTFLAHKDVKEFVFENGILVEVNDYSKETEKIRDEIKLLIRTEEVKIKALEPLKKHGKQNRGKNKHKIKLRDMFYIDVEKIENSVINNFCSANKGKIWWIKF